MQQLNAHDAMFVHFDNENWAAHGGMVAIYDPSTAPGGRVRFRDILARRSPLTPTPSTNTIGEPLLQARWLIAPAGISTRCSPPSCALMDMAHHGSE